MALCFDDVTAVEAASRAAREFGVELGGLIEIDVGMHRCGIAPGELASVLAQQVANAPGLRFRGLQAYHGAAQHLPSLAEREHAIQNASVAVRTTIDALGRIGLNCDVVSGAGTGTFRLEGLSGLWNEIQVGSYIFMDTAYAKIGGEDGERNTEFEHALFVLATVMSTPASDRVVVDAGLKSYSGERGPPWVQGKDDVEFVGVSDEHGTLKLGPRAQHLRLGDKVLLIPGHCDPTVNLHYWYVAVRRGRVEAVWPITARGASI